MSHWKSSSSSAELIHCRHSTVGSHLEKSVFLAVCLSFFKRFLTLRIILRKKIVADLIVWCVVFVIEELFSATLKSLKLHSFEQHFWFFLPYNLSAMSMVLSAQVVCGVCVCVWVILMNACLRFLLLDTSAFFKTFFATDFPPLLQLVVLLLAN